MAPPGDAQWKVGTFTVPAAGGSVAVTGLGGTPQAVFFFGTNWVIEDAVETSAGTGVFRGMAAPRWDSPGTIVQNVATVTPPGNQHSMQNVAILMQSIAGTATTLYAATFTSFDADGFTVNFTTGAAGGYKIVYVALFNVTDVGGYIGGDNTLSLGWKAGASLAHGAWSGPSISGSDRSQEWYGGGAYPGATDADWFGAGLTAFTFPTAAGGGQYNIGIYNQFPSVVVAQGGHFIGPFLSTANMLLYPDYLGSTDDFVLSVDSTAGGAVMSVMWSDDASITGQFTPPVSSGGQTVVSGLPFAPGLLIGYSISNEPQGQASGDDRGAIGFSVVTPDFQWTALADGQPVQGAFQSFQLGFSEGVSGSGLDAHAGTIELTEDGFIATTVEDGMPPSAWVWHAFGHPTEQFQWIPHIYRRILG